MIDTGAEYEKEFEELVGNLAQNTRQLNNDPVAIAVMLYSIAEERKSTNLIVKNLNSKIDTLVSKIEHLEKQNTPAIPPHTPALSERDAEVLEYLKKKDRVCAENLQERFKYKGKNAGSARLSKLFHEGLLEKEYAGRRVYYKIKQ